LAPPIASAGGDLNLGENLDDIDAEMEAEG
jgi:hypothetical protein